MKLTRSIKAFTLVEIMIVVAVIGILAAVAIPNFVNTRAVALKKTCIANMCKIRDAVELYSVDTGTQAGVTPLQTDITPVYIRKWPKCAGTEYNVPAVGSDPVCPNGIESHTLNPVGDEGSTPGPPPASPFW